MFEAIVVEAPKPSPTKVAPKPSTTKPFFLGLTKPFSLTSAPAPAEPRLPLAAPHRASLPVAPPLPRPKLSLAADESLHSDDESYAEQKKRVIVRKVTKPKGRKLKTFNPIVNLQGAKKKDQEPALPGDEVIEELGDEDDDEGAAQLLADLMASRSAILPPRVSPKKQVKPTTARRASLEQKTEEKARFAEAQEFHRQEAADFVRKQKLKLQIQEQLKSQEKEDRERLAAEQKKEAARLVKAAQLRKEKEASERRELERQEKKEREERIRKDREERLKERTDPVRLQQITANQQKLIDREKESTKRPPQAKGKEVAVHAIEVGVEDKMQQPLNTVLIFPSPKTLPLPPPLPKFFQKATEIQFGKMKESEKEKEKEREKPMASERLKAEKPATYINPKAKPESRAMLRETNIKSKPPPELKDTDPLTMKMRHIVKLFEKNDLPPSPPPKKERKPPAERKPYVPGKKKARRPKSKLTAPPKKGLLKKLTKKPLVKKVVERKEKEKKEGKEKEKKRIIVSNVPKRPRGRPRKHPKSEDMVRLVPPSFPFY